MNTESSTTNITPNPIKADPYIVHHLDSPSTILATPLLIEDNYGSLSHAVTMAFQTKIKLGYVDGSLPIPKENDAISNWERCNGLVGSWIFNSVSLEIRPSIIFVETSSQIWEDLKDRFSLLNASKIYQLKQLISSLRQEGKFVSLYLTQHKSLWGELGSIL